MNNWPMTSEVMTVILSVFAYIIKELLTKKWHGYQCNLDMDMEGQRQKNRPNGGRYTPTPL